MSKQEDKIYYAIHSGHRPGIYTDIKEASAQIDGFPAAIYKSFPILPHEDAKRAKTAAEAFLYQTPRFHTTGCFTVNSFRETFTFEFQPHYAAWYRDQMVHFEEQFKEWLTRHDTRPLFLTSSSGAAFDNITRTLPPLSAYCILSTLAAVDLSPHGGTLTSPSSKYLIERAPRSTISISAARRILLGAIACCEYLQLRFSILYRDTLTRGEKDKIWTVTPATRIRTLYPFLVDIHTRYSKWLIEKSGSTRSTFQVTITDDDAEVFQNEDTNTLVKILTRHMFTKRIQFIEM